jgi:hypothetical protein
MMFGKEVNEEVLDFIEKNWDWSVGYKTKTLLLTGLLI